MPRILFGSVIFEKDEVKAVLRSLDEHDYEERAEVAAAVTAEIKLHAALFDKYKLLSRSDKARFRSKLVRLVIKRKNRCRE